LCWNPVPVYLPTYSTLLVSLYKYTFVFRRQN